MYYCILYCILSALNSNITFSWCIIVLSLMSMLFVACCIFIRYYTHFPFAASLDSTLASYLCFECMMKSLSASIKKRSLFYLTTLKTLFVPWVKYSQPVNEHRGRGGRDCGLGREFLTKKNVLSESPLLFLCQYPPTQLSKSPPYSIYIYHFNVRNMLENARKMFISKHCQYLHPLPQPPPPTQIHIDWFIRPAIFGKQCNKPIKAEIIVQTIVQQSSIHNGIYGGELTHCSGIYGATISIFCYGSEVPLFKKMQLANQSRHYRTDHCSVVKHTQWYCIYGWQTKPLFRNICSKHLHLPLWN